MVKDLDAARRLCEVSPEEAALLVSPQRPIVLLSKRDRTGLAPALSPGVRDLGVMLPYTPLHHLIMAHRDIPEAVVMTSGNRSDEPICTENDESLSVLSGIADFFLFHNREIVTRVDDSVIRFAAGRPRMIRRSRGYVPSPIPLAWKLPHLLACGAELKSTFCLSREESAFPSQHIGDLKGPEALDFFTESVEHLKDVLEIEPETVVCDLHPAYLSTRYARGLSLPAVAVQHHHAHAVSVMAEHGLDETVIAVILDGTGYGPDGTVWGGEVLLANHLGYERVGRLRHLPLPGSDAAARSPWRMGLSSLWASSGASGLDEDALPEALRGVPPEDRDVLGQMLARGLNSPLTSSCGRLFDAVAALIGLRLECDYEGQAAAELETLAWQACGGDLFSANRRDGPHYPVTLEKENGVISLDSSRVVRSVLHDLRRGAPAPAIALGFHRWLTDALARIVEDVSRSSGITTAVLGGGCMQNALLLEGLTEALRQAGLSVYSGEEIPSNDGGISLGQIAIGGAAHVPGYTHAGH
jgi:hydrogenase maturation protein HypF